MMIDDQLDGMYKVCSDLILKITMIEDKLTFENLSQEEVLKIQMMRADLQELKRAIKTVARVRKKYSLYN